jgi:hypothetical protein
MVLHISRIQVAVEDTVRFFFTLRQTVYVPALVYAWAGLTDVEKVPSPNDHSTESVVTRGVLVFWKAKFMGLAAVLDQEKFVTRLQVWFTTTTTVLQISLVQEAVEVALAAFFTLRQTVYVPALA